MNKKAFLLLVFLNIIIVPALAENITTTGNQPFAIIWDSDPPIAGKNSSFVIDVLCIKETDYLKNYDLTDFYVDICIKDKCTKETDRFIFELNQKKEYKLLIEIPEKIVTNITCENEFTCRLVYDYPSNGVIKIGYKRFDKNFPYTYEEEFKIEHIKNETSPIIYMNNPPAPIGSSAIKTLSEKFSMNYFMIFGTILFAVGLFAVALHQRWGFLLIVAGIILFILGLVFS